MRIFKVKSTHADDPELNNTYYWTDEEVKDGFPTLWELVKPPAFVHILYVVDLHSIDISAIETNDEPLPFCDCDACRAGFPQYCVEVSLAKLPKQKSFTVKCMVRDHVAMVDTFWQKDDAVRYAEAQKGAWTNNTLDGEFHQYSRIVVYWHNREIMVISMGMFK